MQQLGKYQIKADPADLGNSDSIASYLVDAAGAVLTSTLIGAKQSLDALDASSHLDGAAYAAGSDYLSSMGAVDESGNWQPLNINAAGELLVNAVVDTAGDYAEDSAHVSGDIGIFNLSVRRDARSSGTSADGDYASFNTNAVGELWVKDADTLAELVLIKGDTASIATSSGTTASNTTAIAASVASIDSKSTTIATNTGNTATNTSNIHNDLVALSKAEDAAHSSGDLGIQALAVRKDASGSNASADGDYASLIVWSDGSLKTNHVANASILQQQVAVSTTAAQVPAANLANRKTLMLQNTGASKVWIGSATLTSTGAAAGIELPANSFMELEAGPAVAVFAKTNAGSGQLNVLEMA